MGCFGGWRRSREILKRKRDMSEGRGERGERSEEGGVRGWRRMRRKVMYEEGFNLNPSREPPGYPSALTASPPLLTPPFTA